MEQTHLIHDSKVFHNAIDGGGDAKKIIFIYYNKDAYK